MKKLLSFILSITVVFSIFSLYSSTTVNAAVKLSSTKLSIGIGESTYLGFEGAKNNPTWSNSNSNIASIEVSGSYATVKGIKQGTTTITATYYNKKFTCNVTVTPKHVKTSKVYIQQGKLYNIKSTSNTYKNAKIYDTYSNDSTIATGFKTGNIKGVKPGITNVSFYFQSEYMYYTYYIDVIVVPTSTATPTFSQTHNIITATNGYSEISLDGKNFSKTITGLSENKQYKVYYRNVHVGTTAKRQVKSTTVKTNSKIQKTAITNGKYLDYSTSLVSSSTYGMIDNTYYYVKDQNFFSVVVLDKSLHINKYDSNLKYISSKTIALSYPVFGGFYDAPDGNFYVSTGQINDEKTQGKRVSYCVTKFDQNWNALGEATISSDKSGTVSPFRSGTCSMTLVDNTLIMHAARLRYKSSDGLNHQSNFTVAFDTITMNPIYIAEAFPSNHVSHSFQSFVRTDGDNLIFVDHGDAYPRSIYMQTLPKSSFSDLDSTNSSFYSQAPGLDLLEIIGSTGANYTGSNVSGVEVGLNGNIVIGNSVPQNNEISGVTGASYSLMRNIYLSVSDKLGQSSSFKWLTNYNPNGKTNASIPRLVKVNEDKFVIMFVVSTKDNDYKKELASRKLMAITINSSGNILSTKNYSAYFSGNSQPIYFNGKIIWYENNPLNDNTPKSFYTINT